MNRPVDDLVLRKEVLLARSSLCRLKIRYRANALRQCLSWRQAGATAVRTAPARTAFFLLAAEGLGRDRMARWLAFAGRVLAIARLTNLALALLRRPPAGPPGHQPQ